MSSPPDDPDFGPTETIRLDEFTKDEWRDVCRRLRPDITDDEFDEEWREFQAHKRRRRLN